MSLKKSLILRKTDAELLYHYYPLRRKEDLQYIRQAIIENEIYFSSFTGFNDPFDCIPVYEAPIRDIDKFLKLTRDGGRYDEKRLKAVEENWKTGKLSGQKLSEHMLKFQKNEVSKKVGVFCLSSKRDNILMWSHYASSHTGVCLEFLASSKTEFFGEARELRYVSKRPVTNLFKGIHKTAADDTFLTKNKDWKYENEYRMVSYDRPPGIHKYPKKLLKGVILGAGIKAEDEQIFIEMVKPIDNVKLYKAVLSPSKYLMDVKEIN